MLESDSIRLVNFLNRPGAYPDAPSNVQLVETHISWVFLTDRFAYKLKKPVKFDFLDFSTPALRHRACLEECRLNRRLAPQVYLAVLPLTKNTDGDLQLAGRGREMDWVVQMKRLPAERALDHLTRANFLTHAEVQSIADFLAKFYSHLAPIPGDWNRYCQDLDRHIRANAAALRNAFPAEELRTARIHSSQLRFLNVHQRLLRERVQSNRIVDGHGDLRPEHVYLVDPPAVIDCIEFSSELRRVDTADELNFLAMECEQLGRSDIGERVLASYEQACGDRIGPLLSSFYRSYRACVRAKVMAIRSEQQHDDAIHRFQHEALRYLDAADRYAASLGPPCLLIVFGLMGTGKSTLARQLAQTLELDVLSTDGIRRAMLGASPSQAAYGEGLYRAENRARIYEELLKQAGRILNEHQSVVVDGTFLSHAIRDRATSLAGSHGAAVVGVWCDCPRETALARITSREKEGGAESEARVDLFDRQRREFEPPDAADPIVRLDTTLDTSHQMKAVWDALRQALFAN